MLSSVEIRMIQYLVHGFSKINVTLCTYSEVGVSAL